MSLQIILIGSEAKMAGFTGLLAGALLVFASVGPTCGGGDNFAEERPLDTSIVVARFDASGSPQSYGVNRYQRLDPSTDWQTGRDSVWSATTDAQGRTVIFGQRRAADRHDKDRLVVRLNADGRRDASFGTDGSFSFDMGRLDDEGRHGIVQPDGKIVSAGYVSQPTGVGTQSANRLVLFRLNDNGSLDATFGVNGVVSSHPFPSSNPLSDPWGMAEAYAVGLQGSQYVVAGYGRIASSGPVDVVGFRFSSNGVRDLTWSNAGALVHDVASDNDRARNLIVLPDNRILIAGSATTAPGNVDAMLLLLDANGIPDPTFGTSGRRTFSFGGSDEAFFGIALSPDGQWVAAAGHTSNGASGDSPILAILPLGAGTEVARRVDVLDVSGSRFTSCLFNAASDRVYAAGYTTGTAGRELLLAAFQRDGTLDGAFGDAGLVTVDVDESAQSLDANEIARAITRHSDGSLVVVGEAALPILVDF
ncbi:MAG: hypothetical protein ACKVPX_04345 [Myxococcaceae bacterium]